MDSNLTTPALVPVPPLSRRAFIAGGTAIGASLLLNQKAQAQIPGSGGGSALHKYDINTNGISLPPTEQGDGPAAPFLPGFSGTAFTLRRQKWTPSSPRSPAHAP